MRGPPRNSIATQPARDRSVDYISNATRTLNSRTQQTSKAVKIGVADFRVSQLPARTQHQHQRTTTTTTQQSAQRFVACAAVTRHGAHLDVVHEVAHNREAFVGRVSGLGREAHRRAIRAARAVGAIKRARRVPRCAPPCVSSAQAQQASRVRARFSATCFASTHRDAWQWGTRSPFDR